jgi:hypothetical protein
MSGEQYKSFNCYPVLGVSVTATPVEIRRAWLKRSRRHHPDRGGSNDEQAKINLAYEVLSDPIARQAHNIYWNIFGRYGQPRLDPFAEASRRQQTANTNNFENVYWQKPGPEALLHFRQRFDQAIKKEKTTVWAGLDALIEAKEKQFSAAFRSERMRALLTMLAMAFTILLAVDLPGFWFITLGLGILCMPKLAGIYVGGRTFSIFDLEAEDAIKKYAATEAAKICKKKAKACEKSLTSCATFVELLARASTYDDSEIQVARRVAGCMFLTGYMPVFFDMPSRTLLFADQDERVLVRFRHRAGNSSNVAYVERLQALAKKHGASRALIFSSPGFSQNATAFADAHSIKYYSLDSMNIWIDEITASNYTGPAGDILKNIDRLSQFLVTISHRVGRRPHQTAAKPATKSAVKPAMKPTAQRPAKKAPARQTAR